MTYFQNKLAIVFGGGRDIGGAVAVELVRRGAQVAFSYQSSDPGSVIDAITAVGQSLTPKKSMLTRWPEVYAKWSPK
jgi:3-oxoacyl-[acyl-carrier protein] reductase